MVPTHARCRVLFLLLLLPLPLPNPTMQEIWLLPVAQGPLFTAAIRGAGHFLACQVTAALLALRVIGLC